MKAILQTYLALFILLFGYETLSAQKYEWVKLTPASYGAFNPSNINIDSKANIITVGNIGGLSANSFIGKFNFKRQNDTCEASYLAKYDTSGNLLWIENISPVSYYGMEFSGLGKSFPYLYNGIQLDKFDNIYVGGSNNCDENFYISKYNKSGKLIWSRDFVQELSNIDSVYLPPYTHINAIIHDRCFQIEENGNILISGIGYHDSIKIGNRVILNNRSPFMAETDSTGNVIWVQQPYSLEFCASDTVRANLYCPILRKDNAGGFYMEGFYTSGIHINGHYYKNDSCGVNNVLAKYDTSGNIIWTKPLNSNMPSAYYNYQYVGNTLVDMDNTNEMSFLMKTSPKNDLYIFNNIADTDAFAPLKFNTCYQGYDQNLYLAKYNTNGQVQWAKHFSSQNFVYPIEIHISKSGYVYIEFMNGSDTLKIDNNSFYMNRALNGYYTFACYNPMGGLMYIKEIFEGSCFTADDNGSVFFLAIMATKANFDSISLNGTGVYIAKLYFPPVMPVPDSIWSSGPNCLSADINFFVKPGQQPDSVLWDFGDGNFSTNIQPAHVYTTPGNFKAFFHSYYKGLDDTISMMINIYNLPSVKIGGNRTLCDRSLILNPGQAGGESFLWSTGDTHASITVTSTGKYWVTGTLNGCTASDTANITLLTPVVFDSDNIYNTSFCDKDTSLILDA